MRCFIITLLLFFNFCIGNCQYSITSEPIWVINESYNAKAIAPENELSAGTQILLYTEQINTDSEEVYIKSVAKAIEYSGIQNISTVLADYDPSYQKLRFHAIDVIRNGQTINKLSFKDIQTARRETNAENFIYDGTISAFVNIPDVRIGDIVSYSYSVKGFNPIQKKKFSTSFSLNSTQYINKLSIHIFGKKKLHHKAYNTEIEVIHNYSKGINHYEWKDKNIPAILLEDQSPSWYIQNAIIIVTEYNSWSDVINWGENIFTFNEPLNIELEGVIKKIKKSHSEEGDRIRAALAFVQNEIRYLAIHSGIGGYKPNSPNKVVKQRFGDCKDKSVLLTEILKRMGIKAYPTLVNTTLQQSVPDLPPSPKLFDHCIVKVVDNSGNTLWYDPTLTNQGGTYDNIYLPDYRYGLVLDNEMNAMDTITNFGNNMVETFSTLKLNEMGKGAELEVRTHYYEGEADFIRAVFNNNNKNIIEKELIKFYTQTYGATSSIAPPVFVDDTLKNEFSLLERYKIDSIWRPSVENINNLNLSIYPTNITNVLTMPNQLERLAPYALSYPMVRKQNIKVILPEHIQIRAESETINSDFFYYDFSSNYDAKSKTINLKYYYKSQDDHVPVSKFKEFYKDMVKLDRKIGYMIFINKDGDFLNNSISFNVIRFVGYSFFILIVLIGIIIGIIFLVKKLAKKR